MVGFGNKLTVLPPSCTSSELSEFQIEPDLEFIQLEVPGSRTFQLTEPTDSLSY